MIEVIDLLKKLIATPSFSKEEDGTADVLETYFHQKGLKTKRIQNNVVVGLDLYQAGKQTILLNSHHDTVQPNSGYTQDPFSPTEKEGRLYGLGSNDAGGALVALIAAYERMREEKLNYNLLLLASAEEEISGKNGVELALKSLPEIDFGIVGEPTEMKAAVAEKGLMVIDAKCHGKAGHAARNNGENSIYKAMKDISWISQYQFAKNSDWLGKSYMQVTQINAGSQHNVIPANCEYVIDVRLTECDSFEEVLALLSENLHAEIRPRSTRLKPSGLKSNLVHQILEDKEIEKYGSPTLSDQALMPFDTLKMGPGKSERSHMADEYIDLHEIESAINQYEWLLNEMNIKIESYETVG